MEGQGKFYLTCRKSWTLMDIDFLLRCFSEKQKLSFRAQMMLVPGFRFVHVDHRQPILHLVALQIIKADTGFSGYIRYDIFNWA